MRDCLRRVTSPREGRLSIPPLTHLQLTHLPKRPSRDVTRRIQPYGLSPPAKTNAAYAVHECACFAGCTNGKWRSCELVSGGVVPPVPLSFKTQSLRQDKCSAPCGPCGVRATRSGNPTPSARANILRGSRMRLLAGDTNGDWGRETLDARREG